MSEVQHKHRVTDQRVMCYKCKHFVGSFRQHGMGCLYEWHAVGAFQSFKGQTRTQIEAKHKILDAHNLLSHSDNLEF